MAVRDEAANRDGDLVALAQQGDESAFRDLYEANIHIVHRYATVRVGADAADDIASETFFRAWRALPQYEHRSTPFCGWLVRIARNLIISGSRRRSVEIADGVDLSTIEGDLFEHLSDDRAVVSALMGVAEVMSSRYRLVLELRFLADLSVVEVAELLDVSEESVRTTCSRALKAVRGSGLVAGLREAADR